MNSLLFEKENNIIRQRIYQINFINYLNEIKAIESDETKNFVQKKFMRMKLERKDFVLMVKRILKDFEDIETSQLPLYFGTELAIDGKNRRDFYDIYILFDQDKKIKRKVKYKKSGKSPLPGSHIKFPNEIDLSFLNLDESEFPKVVDYITYLIEENNPETWEELRDLVKLNKQNIKQAVKTKIEAKEKEDSFAELKNYITKLECEQQEEEFEL